MSHQNCISDLRPGVSNKILEARVYRKWVVRKSKKPAPIDFCCILIDRESNAIQANMGKNDISHFNSVIQVGDAYRISNFTCWPTAKFSQTLKNDTILKFGRYTKFDNIPADGFPKHYFDFVSYNQLGSRIHTKSAKKNEPQPILTDYIGCLTRVGDVQTFGSATGNVTIVRKMDVENLNGDVVEFTLWDKPAQDFDKDAFEKEPPPVIVAVSSCRVSEYAGTIQLLATHATHYYLNPDIPELAELQADFAAKFAQEPLLDIQTTKYTDIMKESDRNRISLSTLLDENPERYKWVRFTSDAIITGINTNRDWYYESCTRCARKVEKHAEIHYCPDHGPQTDITYRYNFKIFISDSSATVTLTCFTPNGKSLTGYDCPELVAKYGNPAPQDFPLEITNIKHSRHIFQFHYNPSCDVGNVDFYFDDILDAPLSIGNPDITDTGMADIGASQTTMSCQPTSDLETADSLATKNRPVMPSTPATPSTDKIIATSAITTITGTFEEENTQAKNAKKQESRNVKRPLFPDIPAESKKEKTM